MNKFSTSEVSELSKALRTVADLLPKLGTGDNVSSPTKENPPGLSYAQRVAAAWGSAALAMTETYNRSWNEVRAGTYDLGSLMRTWATVYETYSDVAVEALKGPSFRSGPEWLHIQYDKKTRTPDSLSGIATLDRKYGQDAVPQKTPFERLGSIAAKSVSPGPDLELFKNTPFWTDSLRRDAIRVLLDKDKVQNLDAGHYVGFVLVQGVTAAPPLVIVLLRVTD